MKCGTAWILMSLSQHVQTSLGTDSSLPLRSLLESKKQIRRNGRQLFSLSQSIFPWSQRPQLKDSALFLVCVLLFTECTFSTFALRVFRGSGRCCCILFQANRSRTVFFKWMDSLCNGSFHADSPILSLRFPGGCTLSPLTRDRLWLIVFVLQGFIRLALMAKLF